MHEEWHNEHVKYLIFHILQHLPFCLLIPFRKAGIQTKGNHLQQLRDSKYSHENSLVELVENT